MSGLKYFLLGFIFVYAIQFFDIAMNVINSYSAILVTECQLKINKMGGDGEEDTYNIGFQCSSEDEFDEEYID